MKVIPAGTTKYLMFDAKTLERNVERSGRGAPPVVVVEVDDTGAPIGRHIGYEVSAEGPVTQAIFPRGHAMHSTRGAFATVGEVVIDREEAELPAPPPPPPADKPAAPRKPSMKKVS